ncbi:MAG TPA: glycosyltransferase, partial [Gemmataceae bacterium]
PPDDALFPGTAETLSRLAGRLLARMRADQDLLRRESEEALGRAAVREEELRAQLRREREEWAAQREALFDEWQREWAEIQAEYGRALDARDAARREVLAWHQRARILDEVIRELSGAPSARLAAPLRLLARKLFRRRLTERGLIVWSEVRPHTPETADPPDVGWLGHLAPPGVVWESAGPDPQFVLPGLIPAGWARIRLRLTGKAEGQAEIYYDDGGGFRPETKIDTFDWIDELTIDVVTRLPRAARAFRLDPLSGQTGTFRVEQFSVESLPPAHALAHALRRKIGLLSAYHCLGRTLRRGLGMLLRGRFREALGKVLQAFPDDRRLGPAGGATRTSYDVWRRRHALTDADRERIRSEVATWADPPLISVLMPVYNPRPEFLERALDSVRAQLYPHWQLCVTDDASTDPRVRSILRRYAKLDQRIEVEFAEANGGISAASNRSLARARGAYVALLDHDDELAEHALFRVAETVRRNPDAEMIYSDEDKLDPEGRHVDPFFKPDWAPEYFLTCMYTCHLSVFRTELARAVGGFRSAFDLAQDYDLALRVVAHVQQATRRPDGTSAESERIAHIPDVLYHWRMAPTSTATGHEAKPQAELAARRAVESYLERIGRAGTVERGPSPGLQRVRFRIVGRPKVSIVIPTAGKAAEIRGEETWFVAHCVESIRRRTTYDNYEVLVVDNDDLPAELQRRLDELGVVRVSYTEPFNLARKLNLGAAKADGEYLILLNDDTEVITPDWIEAMLEYAQWPEIGAVGAKLFFADGHI